MNEPTKQFKEIFESHHDPEIQELKRLLKKREEEGRKRIEDWGLDDYKGL